jgi:outer membrane receptor protein involved in Fe transport
LAGLNGERIAATPENTGVVNYQHDWPVADGKLSLQADSKISSSYFASVANRGANDYGFQKAYTRSDASLIYQAAKFYTVSAWVKNIENKAQLQYGDFPLSRIVVNFPRTYGLNVNLHF